MIMKNLIGYWSLRKNLNSGLYNGDALISVNSNYSFCSFDDESLYLDGTQGIQTSNDILTTNNVNKYTIGIQVKNLTAYGSHCPIFAIGSPGSGVGSRVNTIASNSSQTRFFVANGEGDGDSKHITIPRDDQWHDLVYVWDGTNTICYLDGLEVSTAEGNSRKTTPLALGSYPNITGNMNGTFGTISGNFKNLVIYNTAIPPENVPKIFMSGCVLYNDTTDEYYTIKDGNIEIINSELTIEIINEKAIDPNDIYTCKDILPNEIIIVSADNIDILVNGIKSTNEMIIAKSDFPTIAQSNFDWFKNECEIDNGNIKIVFSTDSGVTWTTHNGIDFEDLSITIPNKDYSLLTEEELNQWNNAKEVILLKGIESSELQNIDFNTLSLEQIRFAYVLNISSIDDMCINQKLVCQFDAKDTMKLMKDDEINIEVLPTGIKVAPKVDSEMIKLNIITSTNSQNDDNSDNNIELGTTDDINLFINSLIR